MSSNLITRKMAPLIKPINQKKEIQNNLNQIFYKKHILDFKNLWQYSIKQGKKATIEKVIKKSCEMWINRK